MARRYRTCISLTREETCFIDGISKGCKFSSSRKLSRASVIRALLSAAKRADKLDINVTRIRNKEASHYFFHIKSTIQHYKKRDKESKSAGNGGEQ